MVNVETIAYEVLTRNGTDLNALVSDRVYFGVAPAGFDNTQAAIVFRQEGGDGGLWGKPSREQNYMIECWGGDLDGDSWVGAALVWGALHDAWNDVGKITVASGVMLQGWIEMAGTPLVHPDTKQKYYVCRVAGKFRGA